jgi:hypothetical protein
MKRCIYLLLFGFFAAQTVGYAEMIQGMIVTLDSANNMLIVRRTDTPKDGVQQITVKVKSDTKTQNVASLNELKMGQEVKIDAKESNPGVYEAESVEVTASQVAAQGSAQTSAA